MRDFAHCSRVFGLDGLEVLAAHWETHSFAPHMHDFYAVSLNYGGRGAFDCRGERFDAAPETCNLIGPGDVHTGRATSGGEWTYRNLHIELSLMRKLLQSLEWKGSFDVRFESPMAKDSVLVARLADVFGCLSGSSSLLESESLLLSVVARLATDHLVPGCAIRSAGTERLAVRRVKDWLETHSEGNASIRTLADVAGLSPYYLVRAFHKQVGIPPHQYQTNVRVHRARKLLQSGATISEVAHQTGFCDQSHLNRCFKNTFGLTPGKYVAGSGS